MKKVKYELEKYDYSFVDKIDKHHLYDKLLIQFIANAESLIRKSNAYKVIKSTIINTYGINTCTYLGNITSEDDELELHHGPIFTLYDLCEIAIIDILRTDEKLSIFKVVRKVLEWHLDNLVPLTILSQTAHQLVHNDKHKVKVFLDYKQSFGKIHEFIKINNQNFLKKHIDSIIRYFDEYNNRVDNKLDIDKEIKFLLEKK